MLIDNFLVMNKHDNNYFMKIHDEYVNVVNNKKLKCTEYTKQDYENDYHNKQQKIINKILKKMNKNIVDEWNNITSMNNFINLYIYNIKELYENKKVDDNNDINEQCIDIYIPVKYKQFIVQEIKAKLRGYKKLIKK